MTQQTAWSRGEIKSCRTSLYTRMEILLRASSVAPGRNESDLVSEVLARKPAAFQVSRRRMPIEELSSKPSKWQLQHRENGVTELCEPLQCSVILVWSAEIEAIDLIFI